MSSVEPTRTPTDEGSGAYWRSLDERDQTPEFVESVHKEFANYLPTGISETTRRDFLKVMGASVALAAAAGCQPVPGTWPRWPKAKILPHAYRPEDRVPGRPEYFATAMEVGGVAQPLLAKSYDGRPIKLEGNPEHAASGGAAGVHAQASILELYDPDRSQGVSSGQGNASNWDSFLAGLHPKWSALSAQRGARLRILSEATSSPSLLSMRARLAEALPAAQWHEYEPISRDSEREGSRFVFNQILRTHYDLSNADVVVTFDADFLTTHPNAIAYTKAFAARRQPDGGRMSRLYAVESRFSVTGSLADHRYPLPSAGIAQAVWALAAYLVLSEGLTLPAEFGYLQNLLERAGRHGTHHPFVPQIAKDLLAHRGHGLVAVGSSQPAGVHALAHILNAALGNVGPVVSYTADVATDRPSHVDSLRELVRAMNAGEVDMLVILGGNPVYAAPGDIDFAAALPKVGTSCHLSFHADETSSACTWHLPRAHYLEAWGDSQTWDGTYTLAQPLIHPIFDGKTAAEFLAFLIQGHHVTGRDLAHDAFVLRFGSDGGWRRAVHDGFVRDSAWQRVTPSFAMANWKPRDADFAWETRSEVVFFQDTSVYDGRFANNGWLQEFPDPMTKLTWDNAALIHPTTARNLGVDQGDLLHLKYAGKSLQLPAYLMPGQAAGSIAVAIGYGRTFGRVATGAGFNVNPFRLASAMSVAKDVEVSKAGGSYPLATTQSHHALFNHKQGQGQDQRLPQLFREATLGEYEAHPDFAQHLVHHPPLKSLWTEHSPETQHRWAMSIDLNSCTGCGACVVACQAENNISVVGKKEVARGREMHWLRVDRYFRGDLDTPEVAHQVVVCMQCENAPCEQVCPVAATLHSAEGLNEMVYNRCVGTRYCSNNCPYKVRRFNWFNNQKKTYNTGELFKMQRNPDVTVRARGVMEKCTYCIQRIKAVTIPARNEQRPIRDGEIVTACAQTCAADAIVFGDLNDPNSRVSKLHDASRSYAMLAELNVKPRTKYLAKIRNPEGRAADGRADGHAGSRDSQNTHAG